LYNWYAGSVSWFGLNRKLTYCSRCEKTRANLKIDILDFVIEHGINKDNIDDYELSLECEGRLIKLDETYMKYSIEEIIQDGDICISI